MKRRAAAEMRWIAAVLCLVAHWASAETIQGKVIKIADGDTLTILDASNRQHKIRLAEIDAPEKKQPFGTRSRQSLAELCFQKQALINNQGRDRYGRIIGRVHCAAIDANAEQVRRGMAWVYDRYVTDRSLYFIQEEARAVKRGLWSDPRPVRPWEWRRPKNRD